MSEIIPSSAGSGAPPPGDMITPHEARVRLEAAIRARCGEDWDDEDSPWQVVTMHDFMARLTRGRLNVDFYVDLLGVITTEEKPINPAQDSGRLVAWSLLLLSLGIAYLMARAVGWL